MAASGAAQGSLGVTRSGAVRPAEPATSRPAGTPPPRDPQVDASGQDRAPASPVSVIMERGLGALLLPPPIDLVPALRAAAARLDLADRAAPGLAALVRMVVAEEVTRMERYLDMRGQ